MANSYTSHYGMATSDTSHYGMSSSFSSHYSMPSSYSSHCSNFGFVGQPAVLPHPFGQLKEVENLLGQFLVKVAAAR